MLQGQITTKNCKSNKHQSCAGNYTGLGISISCQCKCHKKKGQVDRAAKLIDRTVPGVSQNVQEL
jgi:hypothetical protein